MKVINARNVENALRQALVSLPAAADPVMSRAGETLEVPFPVATVYSRPRERVLRFPERDANPFFHLFEALWILAGREDVEWLAQFNKRMREYSDDGARFHGSYGARLRLQIRPLLDLLRRDRYTRRAVLQIWDWQRDLGADSKDIPCNDMIMLKVRRDGDRDCLHMRVLCRSNDVLWGAYGANAVQFSMLQEYLANKLEVEVGTLTQVSDSFHVYTSGPGGDLWKRLRDATFKPDGLRRIMYQDNLPTRVQPLRAYGPDWDRDLQTFVDDADPTRERLPHVSDYNTTYFQFIVLPMFYAYKVYKTDGARAALQHRSVVLSPGVDWHLAAIEWLERRAQSKENLK